MAAGLPGGSAYRIPVKQVATEAYLAAFEHRHRIAGWAVVPFCVCVALSVVEEGLRSAGMGNAFFSLVFRLLFLLVTVPYQVAIHRLTYPGFDFDRGSYGPPLSVVHKYYFFYTILISSVPAIILIIIYYIVSSINIYFLTNLAALLIFLAYIYIFVGFMLVFPQMAVGVKPDLLQAWWMIKGNALRLVLTIIITMGPVYLVSIILVGLIYQLGHETFFPNAVQSVINYAFSLVTMGLWASTLSIFYFYITGKRPLGGGAPAVFEGPGSN